MVHDEFHFALPTNEISPECTVLLKKQRGSAESILVIIWRIAFLQHGVEMTGINASVSMITKGGLNTVTRSLAIEYAQEGIRFNAVAPGTVDTPLHKDKTIAEVRDIVGAVLYLARAGQVTGEIIHVDGGSHAGRW